MDAGCRWIICSRPRASRRETLTTLTEGWLRADVERRFGVGAAPSVLVSRAIGAEIEMIPQFADSHLPVPAVDAGGVDSASIISELARSLSWCEKDEATDPPSWVLPNGARISFEPGGQIEISSARHPTASELISELTSITTTLSDAFDRRGIRLETSGVDPWNNISAVPLQLHRSRYRTMTRYFESLHPSGIRMMRQTASVQVNVECGSDPVARWNLLNAISPYIVAIFANSARYASADTGHQSYRAHLWRTLDPSRTGASPRSERAIGEYALFALNAGAMFSDPREGRHPSFLEWMGDGQRTRADWDLHMSTLFPEIRPKGFFEIRSADMIDPLMIAAPIAFITGIVYDPATAANAVDLLSDRDEAVLVSAGSAGLGDGAIASVARELSTLAIDGCRSLGDSYIAQDDVDRLVEFADRYTRNGRSPADDR